MGTAQGYNLQPKRSIAREDKDRRICLSGQQTRHIVHFNIEKKRKKIEKKKRACLSS